MQVNVKRLRDVIHCIYTCGPDGSTQDCAGMAIDPCAVCKVLSELEGWSGDDRIYTGSEVDEIIAEQQAGDDW